MHAALVMKSGKRQTVCDVVSGLRVRGPRAPVMRNGESDSVFLFIALFLGLIGFGSLLLAAFNVLILELAAWLRGSLRTALAALLAIARRRAPNEAAANLSGSGHATR